MASPLRDTSVAEIERRLDDLRNRDGTLQRTSVLTHMAWVPSEWERAADRVLEGMGPRVPSRTILLHPEPNVRPDRIDATVAQECYATPGHEVCAELVRIWLRGSTARAPASVVVPLQIADLPVFLRWRGRPAFGSQQYEQLTGATDRLIVDSVEWPRVPDAYVRLADSFDRVVVSDLAWARTLAWRAGLAELWPRIRRAARLRVVGPRAEALLLRGWLRSRLRRDLRLVHEPGRRLSRVEVDGERVARMRGLVLSASDLLSAEFETFTRDRVYEAAVRAL